MNNNLHVRKYNFSQYIYPNVRKLGKSVAQCTSEVTLYTNCCTMKDLNISQYDCQKEYEMLRTCVQNKMKNFK